MTVVFSVNIVNNVLGVGSHAGERRHDEAMLQFNVSNAQWLEQGRVVYWS